jgi:thioredoxin 1
MGIKLTICQRERTLTMAREIHSEDYDAEVLGSPVPVLLDVYGEHCPPCRQLAPVIEKLAAHYEGRARVLKIEASGNRELAGRLAISSVPTVLAYQDGREVGRLVGLRPEAAYHKMLGAAGVS